MRFQDIDGRDRPFSALPSLRDAISRHRWLEACLLAICFASLGWAQVTCDHNPAACECEGCRAFLAECDALPSPMRPYAVTPLPSEPATPRVTSPVEPRPMIPGQARDSFGSGVTSPDSIVAPPPSAADGFDQNIVQPPATPPINSLASSLGATSGSAGVPAMIGDFFGSPIASTTTAVRIAGSPLDVFTTFPFPGDDPVWSVQNGIVTGGPEGGPVFFVANDPNDFFGGNGQVTSFASGPVNFTTTLSGAEVITAYNNSGGTAVIPIVDDPETNAFMRQQAEARFGPGGNLVFVATESGILAFEAGTTPPPVQGGERALPNPVYVYDYVFPLIFVPAPSAGASVGRVRISDNNSALPRDRIFFDYNFFTSVPLTQKGIDVNRFTPGFEKVFLGGNASFEVRVPMALTLDSNILADGATEISHGELGNVGLAAKLMLWRDSTKVIAAGLGVSLPTADDVNVGLSDGTRLARVENEAVHLTPYLAMLVQPTSDYYFHGFLQCDFDTGGDTVYANPNLTGLSTAGVWNDQTYLFVDVGAGKWIARDDCRRRGLSGIALTAEAHYTNAITSADFVRSGAIIVGDPTADLDMLNGTVGGHLRWGQHFITTLGYTFPFTDDRVFDGEFRVFANRYF